MFTTKAMGETTITANARNGSMACSRLGSGPLAGRSVLVVCSILFAFALALVGALGIAHPQAALADDSEHVTAVKTLVDSLGADTLGDKQFLLKVAAPAGEEIASLSDEQERTIEQLMGYVLDSEKDDAGRTGAVVLSADEEAALDATSPADYAKKDYGRILQEIQWAYLSRSTDAKATLLDDTYASGQISATSTSGKYQPTTQRFWVLSNIAVSGGIATATLQTDPESTGYTKLVTGGKLYTNQAASGENARFDNVEIALGTTTRIVVESGKYGCYAYSISSSIDSRIGDAAQKAIENASALIDKLPTELSTGAQIAGIQQTLTEALAAYQALPDEQKEALHWQLDYAMRRDLPVNVHLRDAMGDFLSILRDHKGLRGNMHAYSGSYESFLELQRLGDWRIGVGGVVTFKNASLAEVVRKVPLERIVLETDAPYLTPVPYRGRRNESAHIPLVARKVAELKEVPVEEVARVTTLNARNLFGI